MVTVADAAAAPVHVDLEQYAETRYEVFVVLICIEIKFIVYADRKY